MLKIFETRYHENGLGESSCLSIFAIIGLVFAVVGSISYAAYLFIDATHISDIAGIHISKNISLEINDLRGKLYTDEKRGIKDWIIHTDKVNGFEIKHPNDWEMQDGQQKNYLLLKVYKNSDTKSSSLLMTVEVGGNNEDDTEKSLENMAAKEGFAWQDDWKKEEVNGRTGVRSGKTKTADGLIKDAIFWETDQNQKSFYLEATYYTDNVNDAKYNEAIFDNIISEFKFL